MQQPKQVCIGVDQPITPIQNYNSSAKDIKITFLAYQQDVGQLMPFKEKTISSKTATTAMTATTTTTTTTTEASTAATAGTDGYQAGFDTVESMSIQAGQFQELQEEQKKGYKKREKIEKFNKHFVEYYEGLNILPDMQFKRMYEAMRSPLPLNFRVSTLEQDYISVKNWILNQAKKFSSSIVKPIKWYPNNLAFQIDSLTKITLKKDQQFKQFHKSFVTLTQCGKLLRQQAVSMLPPILFQEVMCEDSLVLDMCAAPGSKTTQLLQILHSTVGQIMHHNVIPRGVVVANDASRDRSCMLAHQTKRLASPCILVLNQNALELPLFKINGKQMKFDCVLCDVPCSGDGTMRKNLVLWKRYHPHSGLAQRGLQAKIAQKGAEMLKHNGHMVYSTCSLNPIENQSVVCELLERKPYLKIRDMSQSKIKAFSEHKLANSPGLIMWKIGYFIRSQYKAWIPSEIKWYSTHEEVLKEYQEIQQYNLKIQAFEKDSQRKRDLNDNKKSAHIKKLQPFLFHKIYTCRNFKYIQTDPHQLKRCLRIYPHQQNSGGFFVAPLINTQKEQDEKILQQDQSQEGNQTIKSQNQELFNDLQKIISDNRINGVQVEQTPQLKEIQSIINESSIHKQPKNYQFLNLIKYKIEVWQQIKNFFGISDSFPAKSLFYRTDGNTRGIHLVSESLKEILDSQRITSVNIIHAGVCIFQRCDRAKSPKCGYRVTYEGLRWLGSYIQMRVMNCSFQLIVKLIKSSFQQTLSFQQLSGGEQLLEDYGQGIAAVAGKMQRGSAIFYSNKKYYPIWIGVSHVTLMLPKQQSLALMLLNHLN